MLQPYSPLWFVIGTALLFFLHLQTNCYHYSV
jgi:hypothetical protein